MLLIQTLLSNTLKIAYLFPSPAYMMCYKITSKNLTALWTPACRRWILKQPTAIKKVRLRLLVPEQNSCQILNFAQQHLKFCSDMIKVLLATQVYVFSGETRINFVG